jgi:hypothetical protein
MKHSGAKKPDAPLIRDQARWRGILNLAGFGLTVAFWPWILDRIATFQCVPQELGIRIKDIGYALIAMGTLFAASLAAFAQFDETKNQVAWVERVSWPFAVGWSSGILYLIILLVSSPLSPHAWFPIRHE